MQKQRLEAQPRVQSARNASAWMKRKTHTHINPEQLEPQASPPNSAPGVPRWWATQRPTTAWAAARVTAWAQARIRGPGVVAARQRYLGRGDSPGPRNKSRLVP